MKRPPRVDAPDDVELSAYLLSVLRDNVRAVSAASCALLGLIAFLAAFFFKNDSGTALFAVSCGGSLFGLLVFTALGAKFPSRLLYPAFALLIAFHLAILYATYSGSPDSYFRIGFLLIPPLIGFCVSNLGWFLALELCVPLVFVLAHGQGGLMAEGITPLYFILAFLGFSAFLRSFRRKSLVAFHEMREREKLQRKELEAGASRIGESEERFRNLSEASFEGIAIHVDGRILECNSAFSVALFSSRDALIGRNFLEFVDAASRENALKVLTENTDSPREATIQRKDGGSFRAQLRGKVVPFRGGVARVLAVLDITAIKKTEEELAHRVRFEELVTSISTAFNNLRFAEIDLGICESLSRIGDFIEVDRGYVLMLDEAKNRLETTHSWVRDGIAEKTVLPPEGRELFWWVDRIMTGEPVCLPLADSKSSTLAMDEEVLRARGVASLLAIPLSGSGGNIGFLGFDMLERKTYWDDESVNLLKIVGENISNVLQRKRAEDALRESEENFRQLASSVNEVFFLYRTSPLSLIYVSPSFSEMFGMDVDSLRISPSEWVKRVCDSDIDEAEAFYARAMTGQDPEQMEFRLSGEGQKARWISMRTFPVRDVSGKAHRISGLAQDITARKLNEIQLAQARDAEVEIAARIQKTLLLDAPLKDIDGLEIEAVTIASQKVDGDFYNFFKFSDRIVDMAIGDVMGKGIPAALFGAAVKSAFLRSSIQLLVEDRGRFPTPVEIVTKVHEAITGELIKLGSFLTLQYVRFDLERTKMDFLDCGHTPAIHYRKATDSCWLLKGKNVPLGFLPDEEYEQYSYPIDSGDLLVFYSDGITETQNAEGELFGEERLVEIVRENASFPPEEMAKRIRNTAMFFSNTGEFKDDLTCVVVKVNTAAAWRREARRFPSDLDILPEVRNFVSEAIDGLAPESLSPDSKEALVLAVNEAAVNVIEHAQPHVAKAYIDLEVGCGRDWYFARFHYPGKFFDWTERKTPNLGDLSERGYGMYIIDQCVDSVCYARDDQGFNMICLSGLYPGKVVLGEGMMK